MIVVYRGKMPQVTQNFGGKQWLYQNGVPSYMSEAHFRKLKSDEIVEFDAQKFMQTRGGAILIQFPSHPTMAIAAIYAAEKARRSYPTCRVDATCHPSIRRLLPDWVNDVTGRYKSSDYCQIIDLRPQQRHIPSDHNVLLHGIDWRRLALIAGGLDEPKDDHTVKDWVPALTGWAPTSNRIAIVSETEGFRSVITIGSDLLTPAFKALGFSTNYVAYRNDDLGACIDAILDSRCVVALADSPLTYIAGVFGIPVVMFKHKATTLDYSKHYKYLTSCHAVSLADAESVEQACDTIVASTLQLMQSQIVAEHNSDVEAPASHKLSRAERKAIKLANEHEDNPNESAVFNPDSEPSE